MEDHYNSQMDADNTLQLTEKMKESLTEAAKWTKFMAIVGFVLLGLMFCALLVFATSSVLIGKAFPGMEQLGMAAPVVTFLFAFVFYGMFIFIPCWFMFRFGSKTLKSIPTMDVAGMEVAFESLKSIFKFYGILMVVVLCIYAILFTVLATTNVF